jgi:hypothetical protein
MYLLKNRILMLVTVALAGSGSLTSCERPATQSLYYNIDSLLQEQASFLAGAQAILHKQAKMNSLLHDSVFAPFDSVGWTKELDIFTEIGIINKPINRGGYSVTDGLPDETSNLTIREYTATKPMPLHYLKTYYLNHPSNLRKIEAYYEQENVLMKSRRKLVMEFTDVYQKNILSAYTIEGSQKMFVGDSVQFTISATVHLN